MQRIYHRINSLVISGALLMFGACGNHENHSGHEHHDSDEHSGHAEKEEDSHAHGEELIEFSPEKQKAAGILTEKIVPGMFYGVISVGGRITGSSGDERTVVATGSGIVRFARDLTAGMSVSSATPLFYISSAGMADEGQTGQAAVEVRISQSEYERAKKLADEKLISEKELQEACRSYELAEAASKAIGKIRSGQGVTVTAPLGGYVKDLYVNPGAYVNAGDPLMLITQNRNLYLRAEVPERYFSMLDRIESANFRPSYSDRFYSIAELGGHKIGSSSAPGSGSRMIPVTFEFANGPGLVGGSYTEVKLLTGKRENVMSVPKTALIEDQGIYHVFVRHDKEHFEKTEVEIGDNDGLRVEIRKGLHGGDEVVTSGAMKLKLASTATAIPAHSHNH